MQDILINLKKDEADLFEKWKEECRLRAAARALRLADTPLLITAEEDLHFFYRSFYFCGRQHDFFVILFNNLQNTTALKWLRQAPASVIQNFWAFLPWYISKERPLPEKLHFIINLFTPHDHQNIKPLLNIINYETISYLLSKTANPQLRQLLKERLNYLNDLRGKNLYGFENTSKTEKIPALYGDKIENILIAINLLRDTDIENYDDPYGGKRFMDLLAAADQVFKCGMIEDCLALLLDLYEDYQRENRLVSILDDEKIYRGFYRLLRKALSIYSLMEYPLEAGRYAENIYKHYFPLITADQAALAYLSVYSSVMEGFNKQSPGIMYEITAKSRTIQKIRPAEFEFIKQGQRMDQDQWLNAIEAINQKKYSLPHESFIIAEYLRLLNYLNIIELDGHQAAQIMEVYLEFWYWSPSRLFMNDNIGSQLALLLNKKIRFRADQAIKAIHENSCQQLLDQIKTRPDLFKAKGSTLKRLLLSADFLGVLK